FHTRSDGSHASEFCCRSAAALPFLRFDSVFLPPLALWRRSPSFIGDSMTLLEAIKTRVLLGDGAIGTQLQLAGLESGGCGEAWNIDFPERVLTIQKAYAEAGSDCILTNTFGASRIMLNRHDEADRTEAINKAGVSITRQALGSRGFVL